MKSLRPFCLAIGVIVSCQVAVADAESALADENAYTMLDHLLDLEHPRDTLNQLERYRRWGDVYVEYRNRALQGASAKDLKIFLFMIFIAQSRTKVETLEDSSSVIVSIFVANEDAIVEIGKEYGLLASAFCRSLDSSFTHYDSPASGAIERSRFFGAHGASLRELGCVDG